MLDDSFDDFSGFVEFVLDVLLFRKEDFDDDRLEDDFDVNVEMNKDEV